MITLCSHSAGRGADHIKVFGRLRHAVAPMAARGAVEAHQNQGLFLRHRLHDHALRDHKTAADARCRRAFHGRISHVRVRGRTALGTLGRRRRSWRAESL